MVKLSEDINTMIDKHIDALKEFKIEYECIKRCVAYVSAENEDFARSIFNITPEAFTQEKESIYEILTIKETGIGGRKY